MGERKKFKFDVIIGNPPYQEETIGDNKGFAPPVYHKFLDQAYDISNIVEMIHPGRFLFDAGSTPKDWNQKMLQDRHLKVLFFEQNSSKVFSGTDIKGGVAVTYHDVSKTFEPIDTYTIYPELNSVLHKVMKIGLNPFSSIVYAPESYKFTQKMHRDYPDAESRLSKGHKYDLKSNVFDTLNFIFKDQKPDDGNQYIGIYGLSNKKRTKRYIRADYIKNETNLNAWKVFVPKANGSGAIGEVLSTPLIGNTQTFISIGNFKTQEEAAACNKYIKTRFARAMLGILKITQDNTKSKWEKVPLQDFTSHSDIDWSQSIAAIDRQLYKKYGLSQEEIDFIESHVKEMV
mgnify:FL=1